MCTRACESCEMCVGVCYMMECACACNKDRSSAIIGEGCVCVYLCSSAMVSESVKHCSLIAHETPSRLTGWITASPRDTCCAMMIMMVTVIVTDDGDDDAGGDSDGDRDRGG